MTINDLITISPLLVLSVWGVLLLLFDLWIPSGRKYLTALLAAGGLALSLGLTLSRSGYTGSAFNGMVIVDGFAIFLDVIFLIAGLAGIALAYDYLKRMEIERGEYYSLLLFTICGMILMTYASDLIIIFLALELLSLPLYILSGFARLRLDSEEAALKYFLLGAFSTGILLYGIALVYGATMHTDLSGIVLSLGSDKANPTLLLVGAVLLLVGFGFKTGIVPFHMWVPDVYQGAPSSVTGFMSFGAKAAGFAALMRVFITSFQSLDTELVPILGVLAALTMIVGNVLAISQSNIKRMLAYASIAQSGYLLMAFLPYSQPGLRFYSFSSMLIFLLSYGLTTLGAWAVVISLEKADNKGLSLEDYSGLGRKVPWLGASMAIFMFSYIGIPLTIGFWGKFFLFNTAVAGGYTILALIGLITSLISAFYYLRVVVIMYMRPGEPNVVYDPWLHILAVIMAVLVVGLGLIPAPVIELAAKAVISIQ